MKLYLTILSTTLFLITFSYPAIAGTSFTGLSGKVTVLDLAEEKRKSDEQQHKAKRQARDKIKAVGATVVSMSEVIDE